MCTTASVTTTILRNSTLTTTLFQTISGTFRYPKRRTQCQETRTISFALLTVNVCVLRDASQRYVFFRNTSRCSILIYQQNELNAEAVGRQGRKKIYPECKLHGKTVYTWQHGNPTATAPVYDSTKRKANAKATIKSGDSRRAKAESEPESEFSSEVDGEFEYEEEYEDINEPGGSRRLLTATLIEEEEDKDVYIDESKSSPPVRRQAGDTQPPEQPAAPLTDFSAAPQTALGFALCCGIERLRSVPEEGMTFMLPPKKPGIKERIDEWGQYGELPPLFSRSAQPPKQYVTPWEIMHGGLPPVALTVPCIGSKRALEEADASPAQRSRLEDTKHDIPLGHNEVKPVNTFEPSHQQELRAVPCSDTDFAVPRRERSRWTELGAYKASIGNSLRLAAPPAPHRLGY